MNRTHTIAIMAGGTGGHVYPASSICARLSGHRLIWLGRPGGLEETVAQQTGVEFFGFDFCTPRKLSRVGLCAYQLWRSSRRISQYFRLHRPDVAIGFGGYVSVPGAVAALRHAVPLLIHEQNRRPGLANRLLAPMAKHIITAYPDTFARQRTRVCMGNPLRPAHGDSPRPPRARRRNTADGDARRILVLGGSLGARSINAAAPAAFKELIQLGRAGANLQVRHLCGHSDLHTTTSAYAGLGEAFTVTAFSEQIHEHYDWADLVVCRGGAMTLAELAHHALPAIIVPLAQAAANHQYHNALYYADIGAARVVDDNGEMASGLVSALDDLLTEPRLTAMSAAMHSLAGQGVADDIVAQVLAAAGATDSSS
ncbi:MAG: undecaprenyldiphospho-muramoylpentapeptide beta-N-acetylglucosaminyltransferase [Proteobacteria bacterium]|nr:undecaprenyldiphospho-muramoylpentapeptide beta-N-acetylglucosaminyltransferase [Pseudomonadota bacterium]